MIKNLATYFDKFTERYKRFGCTSTRMSQGLLRVVVRCPGEKPLYIEANPLSNGSSLRSLVQLISFSGRPVYLVFKGRQLLDDSTLRDQGVVNGEEFDAKPFTDEEIQEENNKKERLRKQIRDVYNEVVRISDVQAAKYEMLRPDLFMVSSDESEEFEPIFESKPKSDYKASEPSTKPLPAFWDNYSDTEEEEDVLDNMLTSFSSVEQASTFFRKEGWTW